ncbi:MAG: alpha/beta hydrolase fold domain-containing protein [Actinobacteria bacterium]|nr:alpha/beta hydrolase fold domain-containing protein [Actinomycetota bacterium]
MRSTSVVRPAVLAGLLISAIFVLWWVSGEPKPFTPARAGADAIYEVSYGEHPRQQLDVYLPDQLGDAAPAVIWIHPGGWVSGDKGRSMPVWDWTERGFAVISINYRFADDEHTLLDSVADGIAATRFVRANASAWGIDPDRIGVYGFSAGGHLAAMIAASDVGVAAVATVAAPTNFGPLTDPSNAVFEVRTAADAAATIRARLGCDDTDCSAAIADASPTAQPPPSAPVRIVHGDADTIVDISQAEALAAAWGAPGSLAELVIVADGGHATLHLEADIEAWFVGQLRLSWPLLPSESTIATGGEPFVPPKLSFRRE